MAYLSQSGHQNPNAGGTDDQQFSLNTASNVVTFTLEDGGTPQTLDLTPYLPDGTGTDDQRISQFGVIGTNLVISIEDGNTVSLPLSSLPDNDQQTLSLAGSTLSIFDGNSVNLASINTDNQILTTTVDADGNTDSVTISGGNTISIQHTSQSLTVTKETIRSMHEYVISDTGVVTKISSDAPDLTVGWEAGSGSGGAGNGYEINVGGSLANINAWLIVEGDINTGSGSGINANALSPQDVKVSGNLITFTLFSGDDGGGADDARRRGIRLFVSYDKDVITDVTLS